VTQDNGNGRRPKSTFVGRFPWFEVIKKKTRASLRRAYTDGGLVRPSHCGGRSWPPRVASVCWLTTTIVRPARSARRRSLRSPRNTPRPKTVPRPGQAAEGNVGVSFRRAPTAEWDFVLAMVREPRCSHRDRVLGRLPGSKASCRNRAVDRSRHGKQHWPQDPLSSKLGSRLSTPPEERPHARPRRPNLRVLGELRRCRTTQVSESRRECALLTGRQARSGPDGSNRQCSVGGHPAKIW